MGSGRSLASWTYCVAPGASSPSVGTLIAGVYIDEDARVVVEVYGTHAWWLAAGHASLGNLCHCSGIGETSVEVRTCQWRRCATKHSGKQRESDSSDDKTGGSEESRRGHGRNGFTRMGTHGRGNDAPLYSVRTRHRGVNAAINLEKMVKQPHSAGCSRQPGHKLELSA